MSSIREGLSLRAIIPSDVRRSLKQAERALEHRMSGAPAALSRPAIKTLSAGGKRLRPALVLLCAGTSPLLDPLHAAQAVELIHMGSLVHDDIVDDNHSRRGAATVMSENGELCAVAVGDLIFARAFDALAEYPDTILASELAAVVCEMGEGELEQLAGVDSQDLSLDSYFERVRKKTAELFAVSCRMGAICAGLSAQDQEALSRYGRFVGIAFQIYDDVLDLVGDEAELGKPRGTDIKEANLALPLVLALSGESPVLRSAMGVADDPGLVASAIDEILSGPIVEECRSIARGYVDDAKDALGLLGDSGIGSTLNALADYVIERVS